MKITPRTYAEAYLDVVSGVNSRQLSDVARAFWRLVVRQRKFSWRKKIVSEVVEISRARAGVVSAEVSTARETNAELKGMLERGLRKSLGKEVEVSYEVKPHLLAGMVLQVEDTRFDASLKGKLDAMEKALVGGN